MARITLQDIRHAYGPNPEREEDWALKRLTLELKDGESQGLLRPVVEQGGDYRYVVMPMRF